MASLALVFVLCALVSLSDSYCFREHLKPGRTQCKDGLDGSLHAAGSTWTNSRCLVCSCFSSIMECCDKMGRAIVHTEGCVVEYDYSTCTFEVFNPEDPNLPCSYGAVGKK